jgi:hypothetical protein
LEKTFLEKVGSPTEERIDLAWLKEAPVGLATSSTVPSTGGSSEESAS